jgi:hypothetical protein
MTNQETWNFWFHMAVIVDKLLSEGYLPDGFVDSIDGRIYKYNLLND